MSAIDAYKIGDELFRYVEGGGIFRYTVKGIRSYEDSTQLEVECQTCSHGWKCLLLLARNDYGRVHAVHMLNDDEDNSQRHWHGNEGMHFWPTVAEAKAEGIQLMIRRAKENVERTKAAHKAATDRLTEMETLLASTEESMA